MYYKIEIEESILHRPYDILLQLRNELNKLTLKVISDFNIEAREREVSYDILMNLLKEVKTALADRSAYRMSVDAILDTIKEVGRHRINGVPLCKVEYVEQYSLP
jgi:hypothetical protein